MAQGHTSSPRAGLPPDSPGATCWGAATRLPAPHEPHLHIDGDVDVRAEARHATVRHSHSEHNAASQGGVDGLSVQGPQVPEEPRVGVDGEVVAVGARQQAEEQAAVIRAGLVIVIGLCRQQEWDFSHCCPGHPAPPLQPDAPSSHWAWGHWRLGRLQPQSPSKSLRSTV